MGSFSWTRADVTTKQSNIAYEDKFKLLIPKEFGGGFIKDSYQDYGDITDTEKNNYDMYELLAFWNKDMPYKDATVGDYVMYEGECPLLKTKDIYTEHNRSIGIDIGCYDDQIDRLKYPLKLVSASYKETYEDCEFRSYGDPNQGFGKISWDDLGGYNEQLQNMKLNRIKYLEEQKESKKRRNKKDINFDGYKKKVEFVSTLEHLIKLMKNEEYKIAFILKKNKINYYKAVAYNVNVDDDYIEIKTHDEQLFINKLHDWDFNLDEELFRELDSDYEFFAADVKGFCDINQYINENIDEIECKEGLKQYAKFYKENNVAHLLEYGKAFMNKEDVVLLNLKKF